MSPISPPVRPERRKRQGTNPVSPSNGVNATSDRPKSMFVSSESSIVTLSSASINDVIEPCNTVLEKSRSDVRLDADWSPQAGWDSTSQSAASHSSHDSRGGHNRHGSSVSSCQSPPVIDVTSGLVAAIPPPRRTKRRAPPPPAGVQPYVTQDSGVYLSYGVQRKQPQQLTFLSSVILLCYVHSINAET